MIPPFDIIELRRNIEGDRDVERALLTAFMDSTHESLALLKQQFSTSEDINYDALWKRHMHQIKGAAMNICADTLAELASSGEVSCACALPQKRETLHLLEEELALINTYIGKL